MRRCGSAETPEISPQKHCAARLFNSTLAKTRKHCKEFSVDWAGSLRTGRSDWAKTGRCYCAAYLQTKTNRIMSSKKKIAGLDKPYSLYDLGVILERYIEEGDFERKVGLEYFIPSNDSGTKLTKCEFDFYFRVKPGGSEGIYASFYVEGYNSEPMRVLCAKTLYEDEEHFVKMSEMAARVTFRFHKFVDKNLECFIWEGFKLEYYKDGVYWGGLYCSSIERAEKEASEYLKEYDSHKEMYTVYIVDMATRFKREYKL